MKTNLSLSRLIGVTSAVALLGLSSCSQYQQQGAAVGALAGGAIGALAGDGGGDAVKGAAIGAAVGAGAAAVKEQHDQSTSRQSAYQNQTAPTIPSSNYPVAVKTETVGYVKSPYSPYNVVDVRGIPAGKLAKEPGTEKIFRIP